MAGLCGLLSIQLLYYIHSYNKCHYHFDDHIPVVDGSVGHGAVELGSAGGGTKLQYHDSFGATSPVFEHQNALQARNCIFFCKYKLYLKTVQQIAYIETIKINNTQLYYYYEKQYCQKHSNLST